jgi:hypothetical protein
MPFYMYIDAELNFDLASGWLAAVPSFRAYINLTIRLCKQRISVKNSDLQSPIVSL